MSNPLLDFSGLPRFDEIKPEHVKPALTELLAQAQAAIDRSEAITSPSWENFVLPLHDAIEAVGRAWNQVGHLEGVVNTPELRAVYNEVLPLVSDFFSAYGQNLEIFNRFKQLGSNAEFVGYSASRKAVIEHALLSFRLGGAELPEEAKVKLAAIQSELAELSAKFSQNVLDAIDAGVIYVQHENELEGVPADVIEQAREGAQVDGKSGYKTTLQMPCFLPVMTYCSNRDLREQLYRLNGVRASETGPQERDNSPLIQRIIHLRAKLAQLLDFPNFAEYSLATKMAQSPEEVLDFLRDLARRAKPFAQNDRAELEAFGRNELGMPTLEAWDIAFVSEKLQQARYSFSSQEVKEYFTEPVVLEGLFALIHELYGATVERDTAPTWHPDVRFYRVVDAQGVLLGQFYLDLYARPGKRSGAWMDDCRNRRAKLGVEQTPVVYLVCNFGQGVGGKPATWSHDEVVTLFHEMGHGLHQLLTEANELGVAGVSGVEWDAVELPSQFMENFCWEWSRVSGMSRHIDTQAPLPRDLFGKMLAARNYQSGMHTVRQLEFALFDMLLHTKFDAENDSVQGLLDEVREEVAVNRPPSWHRFAHQFQHVFAGGYAAGYYSYKWAEVLSADVYAAFEEAPDQIAAVGAKFRQEILSKGGSRPALENFVAFRGREPQIDALVRHSGFESATA